MGPGEPGTIAFVRCIPPGQIAELCSDPHFRIAGWQIFGIVARIQANAALHLIPADEAVEYRESKSAAALLLVDFEGAGAGMDGIYSAAREISEKELFREGIRIAKKRLHKIRKFAEEAVRQAGRIGRHNTISPWREFAFFCECAEYPEHVGSAVAQIGLWPIHVKSEPNIRDCDTAARLVEKCLLASGSATSLARIDGLMLRGATNEQYRTLINFFKESAGIRWTEAVAMLANQPLLWVNNLNPGFLDQQIERIELASWRRKGAEKPYAWSGLRTTDDGLQAVINKDPQSPKERSKIEVRWNAFPEALAKGTAEYSIKLIYGSGEDEFIEQKAAHTGPGVQRAVFTEADFEDFDGTEKFESLITVEVIGKEIRSGPTEEFTLQFGLTDVVTGSTGLTERSLVEGLLAAEDDASFLETISDRVSFTEDRNHHVIARLKGTSKEGKTIRVYRPPLLREIEMQWSEHKSAIGRWCVRVRADGSPVGAPEFQEIEQGRCPDEHWQSLRKASEKLCELALSGGGFVSLVYADNKTAERYITAWQEAIETGDPAVALAQTVEIRTLSNSMIGFIVLPSHPVRVAWYAGYDALARYGRYTENLTRKRLVKALAPLDGAEFPACLPGLEPNQSFVFGDMLGFHAVAMVSDSDKEPKAAISQMAKALGAENAAAASSPATSRILSKEITRYLDLHEGCETIHMNALRSGDGVTVSRALGSQFDTTAISDDEAATSLSFVLQLYPSQEQKKVAGRFLTETSERRRSGAGFIPREDRWMFESHPSPNGTPVPKLRWAKRTGDLPEPTEAAHISVAFDSFIANVSAHSSDQIESPRPWEVFGLAAPMQRVFSFKPEPHWLTFYPPELRGDRHPAGTGLSDRLHRIHKAIQGAVVRNLGATPGNWPVLRTALKPEQNEMFERLHSVSDWVITIDRNAGIEYFDSPRESQQVYDAYVIDCVPEREDLGAFQLITSTANFEEVMILLEGALSEMGLSTSRRNCEFLLRELKGLSGRMAMRLAGPSTAAGELIALSLVFTNSRLSHSSSDWPLLQNGFFIPLDDVPELLPFRQNPEDSNCRGDILLVSLPKRGGFQFQAIEVKYRRYLRSARDQDLCEHICSQNEATIKRFSEQYFPADSSPSAEIAPRRARLARIFRFYAEKARRHYLTDGEYLRVSEEIDKMLELGTKYSPSAPTSDFVHKGFIFCPDFMPEEPESIYTARDNEVFLFGPAQMPDTDVRHASIREETAVSVSQSDATGETSGSNEPASSVKSIGKLGNISPEEHGLVSVLLGSSKQTDEPIYWQLGIRTNPHLMVVGLPGMGKTHALVNICSQLSQHSIIPVVFSYHEDIDVRLEQQIGPLNFIDYNGLGFNPMQIARSQPMAYIDNAGMIRDIFSSIFPDLGDLQLEYLRDAVKEAYKQYGWTSASIHTATPPFQLVYEKLESGCTDKRLLLRLRELNDYGFFSATGPAASPLEAKRASIVRIHSTQNEGLQNAFSSFVLQNVYQSMFARGEQRRLTHAIVIDEAHRASRLKLIPALAKECRKYGILLIIASQEARDFQPSLFSAVGNYLVLRVTDQDAKLLANQSGDSASNPRLLTG